MKKLFLLMLSCIAAVHSIHAFKLESSYSDSLLPQREISSDANGITVSYIFPGAITVSDDLYPGKQALNLPGFALTSTPGTPGIPMRYDTFEIPEGCSAEVFLISKKQKSLAISLSPARPALEDSSDEGYNLDNVPPIDSSMEYKAEVPVKIVDVQIYRDRKIAYVQVSPIIYVDDNHIVFNEIIEYRVAFTDIPREEASQKPTMRHDVDNDYFSSLFTSTLSQNAENDMTKVVGAGWKEAPYYLILSTKELKASVDKFSEWKKRMGFNVEVVLAPSWNPATIKKTIKLAYENIHQLEYVLLIGDAVALPPVRHINTPGSPYNHSSDFTYGCLDGDDDNIQDVVIGRLNVATPSEAEILIDKIIDYEKNPTTNQSYYHNAVHGAYFQDKDPKDSYEDRRFVRTSEDIRNGLMKEGYNVSRVYNAYNTVTPLYWNNGLFGYGDNMPSELLRPSFDWNGSTADVLKGINNGAFYILHRGHGSYNGWASPSLKIKDVDNISNLSSPSVFFNIHCQSGAFGKDSVYIDKSYNKISLSFAEALLRKEKSGAVGVIAASEISYSGYNDVLAMEMFQSIWPGSSILNTFPYYYPKQTNREEMPIFELGKILNKGLTALEEKYKLQNRTQYTKRLFHCFGDPSMEIYTDVPQKIQLFGVSANPYAIRSNIEIQASMVLNDGKVWVAQGSDFDISDYINDIAMITFHGHNLIPTGSDLSSLMQNIRKNSSVDSIDTTHDSIILSCTSHSDSSACVRLRRLNEFNGSAIKEIVLSQSGTQTIEFAGLTQGLYSIEFVEAGYIVDSQKVIIK